jgi:outer membrane lipoprotein carrier protein
LNPVTASPSERGMTSRSRLRFALAFALAVSFPVAAATETAQKANVALPQCRDRAASAVQARYNDVRDVAARFEQTTHAAHMGAAPAKPVASRGRVLLAKPGKMRWTYEEPEPSLVVSDGKTVWIFDPAFGEVQTLPAAEGFITGAAAQFLLGAGDMRRDFTVSAVSCSESAAQLELIPREPASYEKILLDVDPASGDVRTTRIVDLLGNQVVVEFREQRFNTAPADSEFRFEAPAGVKVIEISP